MQLKLTTLNIAGYRDWQDRVGKIVSFLNSESPDVLLLQEVRLDPSYSPLNQADEINSQLNSKYKYSSINISKFYRPSVGEPYREGLAILSRYPILNTETIALTQQTDDKHTRIAQSAEIHADERSLLLANIHLSNNKYSTDQLDELLKIYNGKQARPVIAGDFNIFDLSSVHDLYDNQYDSSYEYEQYVSFLSEDKTLDYVLLPKSFTFTNLHTKTGLSDHAALTVEIRD